MAGCDVMVGAIYPLDRTWNPLLNQHVRDYLVSSQTSGGGGGRGMEVSVILIKLTIWKDAS